MRGVEIHFTRRPDDATLAPLRGDRAWRYTGKTKCWYARQTPETIAWAKTFCENFNGGSARASRAAADAPSTAPGAPSRVVAPPSIPTPQIPAMPGMTPLGMRPERKFIRYAPNPSEPSDPIPPIIPILPMPTQSIADLMRPKI